jgi:hypothetical protein
MHKRTRAHTGYRNSPHGPDPISTLSIIIHTHTYTHTLKYTHAHTPGIVTLHMGRTRSAPPLPESPAPASAHSRSLDRLANISCTWHLHSQHLSSSRRIDLFCNSYCHLFLYILAARCHCHRGSLAVIFRSRYLRLQKIPKPPLTSHRGTRVAHMVPSTQPLQGHTKAHQIRSHYRTHKHTHTPTGPCFIIFIVKSL